MADPTRIFLRALMRRLPADAVREAMHLAVDALLDDAAEQPRRASVRVPTLPDEPVDEVAERRAVAQLRRRGLVG